MYGVSRSIHASRIQRNIDTSTCVYDKENDEGRKTEGIKQTKTDGQSRRRETERDVREWLTRKGSIASEEPCPPPLYESSSHETLMNPQTLRTLSFQASCSATLLLFLSSQILNRMKFSSRFSSLSPQQPYVTLQSP